MKGIYCIMKMESPKERQAVDLVSAGLWLRYLTALLPLLSSYWLGLQASGSPNDKMLVYNNQDYVLPHSHQQKWNCSSGHKFWASHRLDHPLSNHPLIGFNLEVPQPISGMKGEMTLLGIIDLSVTDLHNWGWGQLKLQGCYTIWGTVAPQRKSWVLLLERWNKENWWCVGSKWCVLPLLHVLLHQV